MSLIPNLSDIPELSIVPAGEYDLRLISRKETTSKDGRKGIQTVWEIVGEDNALNVFDNIWLPMDKDDPGKANTMWRMIKERLSALGLPTDGSLELSDFDGITCSARLEIENSEQYGDKNVIKKIL